MSVGSDWSSMEASGGFVRVCLDMWTQCLPLLPRHWVAIGYNVYYEMRYERVYSVERVLGLFV